MAQAEHNYVHINENWRQRLVKEQHAAQEFDHQYDYLVWKHTPTNVHRPSAAVKVKYYRGAGGSWSVKDKRIGLKSARDVVAPSEPEALKMLADPATKHDAIKSCQMNHTLVLTANARTSPLHRPSSTVIGQRKTLEMFGVGEHGRTAVRTKEPVGNGTKIYIT